MTLLHFIETNFPSANCVGEAARHMIKDAHFSKTKKEEEWLDYLDVLAAKKVLDLNSVEMFKAEFRTYNSGYIPFLLDEQHPKYPNSGKAEMPVFIKHHNILKIVLTKRPNHSFTIMLSNGNSCLSTLEFGTDGKENDFYIPAAYTHRKAMVMLQLAKNSNPISGKFILLTATAKDKIPTEHFGR